jgi:hypothetical protein
MCWGYFSTFRTDGKRLLSIRRIFFLGIIPIAAGVGFMLRVGVPSYSSLQVFVPVLAVLAAVLVGLLPLIHSVLGQVKCDRKYEPGEHLLAETELNRIRVIQDLHAGVSWAVVLLVVALGFAAMLVFLPGYMPQGSQSPVSPVWSHRVQLTCSIVLYSVACSTSFSFFDIASGVFEAVENQAENIKRRIESNARS